LAIAKILGVIIILSKKSKLLKEWAYAGMFFDMVLAFIAHYMADDGAGGMAAMGLIALIVSRYFDWKIYGPIETIPS
jgi:DoxX-like protein